MHEPKYMVMGTNDAANCCASCGKSGLKKVVWLKNLETGEIAHYGIDCAASLMGTTDTRTLDRIATVLRKAREWKDQYSTESIARWLKNNVRGRIIPHPETGAPRGYAIENGPFVALD